MRAIISVCGRFRETPLWGKSCRGRCGAEGPGRWAVSGRVPSWADDGPSHPQQHPLPPFQNPLALLLSLACPEQVRLLSLAFNACASPCPHPVWVCVGLGADSQPPGLEATGCPFLLCTTRPAWRLGRAEHSQRVGVVTGKSSFCHHLRRAECSKWLHWAMRKETPLSRSEPPAQEGRALGEPTVWVRGQQLAEAPLHLPHHIRPSQLSPSPHWLNKRHKTERRQV